MAHNLEKTEQVDKLEEEKSQVVDSAKVKFARKQFEKMMLENLDKDMARAGKFGNPKVFLKIVKNIFFHLKIGITENESNDFIPKDEELENKNEPSQTFAVIHRSQNDPLAADSDAPQRILQPLESKAEGKKNKAKEREYGIFYGNQYDYLQHVKTRDEFLSDNVWDEFTLEASAPESKPARHPISNVKLPDIVFASKGQEEVGLINKAAKISGPLLDWDPAIVETLDDEFEHENVYTLKDEDMEENDNDEFGLDTILNQAKLERDEEEEGNESESGSELESEYDLELDGELGMRIENELRVHLAKDLPTAGKFINPKVLLKIVKNIFSC